MAIGTRFLLLLAALLQICVSARIAHSWRDSDAGADSDDFGQLVDLDDLSPDSDWDEFYLDSNSDSDEDDSDEECLLPAPEHLRSSPEESSDLPEDPQIIGTFPGSPQTAANESSAAPQSAPETSETHSDPPAPKSEIETAAFIAPGQEESALVVVLVMFAGTFLAVFLIYTMLSRGGRRSTSSTLSRPQTSSGEVSRLLKPRG